MEKRMEHEMETTIWGLELRDLGFIAFRLKGLGLRVLGRCQGVNT